MREAGIMTPERGAEDLILAIEHANQTLDWIEKRDGPLPGVGYARIASTVAVVRALRGVSLAVGDGA
jgi:hypothetical protein